MGLFCGFRPLFVVYIRFGWCACFVVFVLLVVVFCFGVGCFLLLSFDLPYLCLFVIVVYVWVEIALFTALVGWVFIMITLVWLVKDCVYLWTFVLFGVVLGGCCLLSCFNSVVLFFCFFCVWVLLFVCVCCLLLLCRFMFAALV